MKTLLLAGLLSCFSIWAFAKSTDVVIGDCIDSNMAIIVDAARGAGETVPAVDSQPMRNMRDNLSQVCASIYQQGQTARGLKGITYTADQARVSMKAAIMANMPKNVPEAAVDRMADTATVAFMAGYQGK